MTSALVADDVDVLIVGAGHAGLAMSFFLTQAGRDHVVVERRETLGGGRQDRWDEFTLVTPNWTASFPGWAYDGTDPDGFMGRDEIAARVARYARSSGRPWRSARRCGAWRPRPPADFASRPTGVS